MTRQVLIVSHADADGHVIAEQVRRNLAVVPSFDISLVVDPARTKDHKTWTRLDSIPEIDMAEIVFFVDLMFAPSSFFVEANALVQFVSERPRKRFFLMDHHPLPLRLLGRAPNLRSVYRPDVLDCTLGPASWLMIIAALLESQPTRAKEVKEPKHEVLAMGVRRAAAPGGPLAGDKLLALLRFDRWNDLEKLGQEDPARHRLPRGRRAMGDPKSDELIRLDQLATKLLKRDPSHGTGNKTRERNTMSYDLEVAERSVRLPPIPRAEPRDLEAIVMLLELAAIYLTQGPESTFTARELIDEARVIGGDGLQLDEADVKIVLGKAGFLRKNHGGRLSLK